MPQKMHVAHVFKNGLINTEWTIERFPKIVEERLNDGLLQPDGIAETY